MSWTSVWSASFMSTGLVIQISPSVALHPGDPTGCFNRTTSSRPYSSAFSSR